jgi:hypothetical protein
VTLVSGSNGSGKSAIMQGLQACLGVTARNTGRASSMATFIRTGVNPAPTQATVEVRAALPVGAVPAGGAACARSTSWPAALSLQVTLWNMGEDAYKPDVCVLHTAHGVPWCTQLRALPCRVTQVWRQHHSATHVA